MNWDDKFQTEELYKLIFFMGKDWVLQVYKGLKADCFSFAKKTTENCECSYVAIYTLEGSKWVLFGEYWSGRSSVALVKKNRLIGGFLSKGF